MIDMKELFLAHPESQTRAVNAGHHLTLSCEIEPISHGNFLGTIEWFHNGSPLKIHPINHNRIDYQNGTLTIDQTSVKKQHHIIFSYQINIFLTIHT